MQAAGGMWLSEPVICHRVCEMLCWQMGSGAAVPRCCCLTGMRMPHCSSCTQLTHLVHALSSCTQYMHSVHALSSCTQLTPINLSCDRHCTCERCCILCTLPNRLLQIDLRRCCIADSNFWASGCDAMQASSNTNNMTKHQQNSPHE